MTLLVRHVNNIYGIIFRYIPDMISFPELELNTSNLIKDLNFHFKDLTVQPPRPGSFISSKSNQLIFMDGIYTKDDFTLNIKNMGISKEGFFAEFRFPEKLYDLTSTGEIIKESVEFQKYTEIFMEEIEEYLLNFSGSKDLNFKRVRILFFSGKFQFKENLSNWFLNPLQNFVNGIHKHTPELIEGTKNILNTNIDIHIRPRTINENGKLSLTTIRDQGSDPVLHLSRRSRIFCESDEDLSKNLYVVSIRDIELNNCWDLLKNLTGS